MSHRHPRPLLVAALAGLLAAPAALANPAESVPGPAAGAARQKITIERVVAIVNDAVILESELAVRAAPDLAELDRVVDPRERQRQQRRILRDNLKNMVDEELVLQAATAAKLEVTDGEVDKAIEEVRRQNNMTERQFRDALAAQGYTLPQYRRDVRKQILRLRAVNVLVRPRVTVTDDEVKERYDRMMGKSAAVTGVRVKHILLRLPERASAEEIAAARRRAGEIVSRARGGEAFDELARAFSADEATKEQGGLLGWFKRGELPTEWEEILFAMGDGEVRGPIVGPQGLHVFQVVETRKEAYRPFEEVKEQLRNQIFNDEMEKQLKVFLEELHKKAHVEIKL